MLAITATLGTIGFAICALGHVVLLVLLATRGRGEGSGRLLLLAVVAEIAWSVGNAMALTPHAAAPWLQTTVESLRALAWLVFLLSLAPPRVGITMLLVALVLAPLVSDALSLGATASFTFRVIAAIASLTWLEQVWRRTARNRRWAMKYLCLALLGKFAFDLALYSDALLFGRLDAAWWAARGYANALLVPMIAVAAARNRTWKLDVNVSRQVVFQSAMLLSSGVFLLLVAAGGYALRFFGGAWGTVAAATLAFAALLGLLGLLASGTARAKLRLMLARHFFSYRYDYRHEWLRLTRRLDGAAESDTHSTGSAATSAGVPIDIAAPGVPPRASDSLPLHGLLSLADLLESPGGALWLAEDDGVLRCGARYGRPEAPPDVRLTDPWLEKALAGSERILDLRGEGSVRSAEVADLPSWLATDREAAFLIPLRLDREIVGLVLLDRPRVAVDLDWEVRDLVRIAARQVASYLAVRRAVEALVQARQFDSFNRMTAFVVHDLKNLVAQLSLMMRNAERHRNNAEFQQDMLDTVRNVLGRMQGLLVQLGEAGKPIDAPRPVRLAPIVETLARPPTAGRNTSVTMEVPEGARALAVRAHRDRLQRVLGHLVQNACEAAGPAGTVRISLRSEDATAVIEVTDDGPGMTEDFVRERLFRPFSTTKAGGMGIGAFECREYVRELSGRIEVSSRPGAGTAMQVRLPATTTWTDGTDE